MTFNGTNVDSYVLKNRITVSLVPVYSKSITTLTGEEKKVLVRYRTELSVPIMPLTAANIRVLVGLLSPNPVSVGFDSPYDTITSRNMYCSNLSEFLALAKSNGDIFSGSALKFSEV